MLALVSATEALAQTEELPLPSSQAVPLTLDDPLWNAPAGGGPGQRYPWELAPIPRGQRSFRDALRGVVVAPIGWFLPADWDSSWEIGLNGSQWERGCQQFPDRPGAVS